MEAEQRYWQATAVLPPRLRQTARSLTAADQSVAEEVRLRVGQPLSIVLPPGERMFPGPPVTSGEIEQMVEIASRASLHAVMDQIRQGYLSLPGGHRLGLCGTVHLQNGVRKGLRPYSGASLRIARQVPGAARNLLTQLCPGGRLASTLIMAPPGAGKTTLLRDLIRMVSDGEGTEPMRVALADERGEVAALYDGLPQLDVGSRTDVLEGCPKAEGLMMLLRAMNPQVLAADEITAPEDIHALKQASGCGVLLLATAHGYGREDLERRPLYRSLLEHRLFERLVLIRREGGQRILRTEVLN